MEYMARRIIIRELRNLASALSIPGYTVEFDVKRRGGGRTYGVTAKNHREVIVIASFDARRHRLSFPNYFRGAATRDIYCGWPDAADMPWLALRGIAARGRKLHDGFNDYDVEHVSVVCGAMTDWQGGTCVRVSGHKPPHKK